jgi:hypothetical protein
MLTATVLFLVHTAAYAQATRTWVSGVGDDVNPCSRTAPCKTFPGAISKTAAGGEIDVLDPGGFGAVTITKSITINGMDSEEAGILVAGTNGITVNCATDPNCIVTIRNININGGPIGSNSLVGIKFIAGAALHVEKCHIQQFTGGSPNGFGIMFAPSTGTSRLYVDDSTITNNGQVGADGGGISVTPTGGGLAYAEITNSQIRNNPGYGVIINDNGFALIRNSNIEGSRRSGVEATSLTHYSDIVMEDNVLTDDGWDQSTAEAAVQAVGALSYIHLSNNVISNNELGLLRTTNGKIQSYSNNKVLSNTTNGAPSSTQTQL